VLLSQVVDRIRNSLELKVVLQTAVDQIATLLQLDRCLFFWHSKDLQRIEIVCERVYSHHPSYLGYYPLAKLGAAAPLIDLGTLIVSVGEIPASNRRDRLRDRLIQPSPPPFPTGYEILGSPANVVVPIRGRDHSLGFIACLADQPRLWTIAEVEMIQSIAQQLESAVRQAQLYEKVQKQAERERLINQLITQTRQSLDLKTILKRAIAHLFNAFEVDRCWMLLMEDLADSDPDWVEESLDAQFPMGQHTIQQKRIFEICRPPFTLSINHFEVGSPMTQWVMLHQQPIVIADAIQDPRIGLNNWEYRLAQIKSSLVVPIQVDGVLLAILYLNQCSHTRHWTLDDQKLAQAAADQLAISIQQAYLYARSQQQAEASADEARKLTETLRHLQYTQAELIQSEKMSSLGQMVAGIAHEINNPISFIYGNIPYVERYVHGLMRLLNAYQALCPQATIELKHLIQEIELDFLIEDLPHILTSMKSGSKRIREIILSLRSFSHLDEAHCKLADINEGLDSTLLMLKSHIKADVHIQRRYSKLPTIECYPRLLNQVFMNLLMNAIEAFTDPEQVAKTITITTEGILDDETNEARVRVSITDNGCGIPYEIQPKVFEPFFTTKTTGQGAGLGLTVSYQTIVNQHQGAIWFDSRPGQGSQFVLEIPLKHSDWNARDRGFYFFSSHHSTSSSVMNGNGNGKIPSPL
jgi:signal transduction histidine kinase